MTLAGPDPRVAPNVSERLPNMTTTTADGPAVRLQRSRLFVPGVRAELFPKAAASAADAICLDLEDSVAPADKDQARANVAKALKEVDFGDKVVTARINGLDTHWSYQDVLALTEQAGDRLDAVLVPKVGRASDLQSVDWLAGRACAAAGRTKPLALEAIIESADGLARIDEIARSTPRLESLHFGAADFAASMGMRTTGIGVAEAEYSVLTGKADDADRTRHWNDLWHFPLMAIVTACRSAGITPIDGPFGDFDDNDAFLAQAHRAAVMGFEGKWAIHPKQVALANAAFTPTDASLERARGILDAMAEAQAKGLGAATYGGQLIDAASIRQAEVVVAKSDRIAARG